MRLKNLTISIFIATFIILVGLSHALSQEISDTTIVFQKIKLTDEGILAVDTNGNEWYYNFDEEQFVEGTGRIDIDEISIEERCTEKKYVNRLEKTLTVGINQYVDDDIIVYGKVTVNGWVQGSIKSLNGKVLVTNTGRVDGDIEAPDIDIRDGGEVLGEIIITNISIDIDDITQKFDFNGLIVAIVLMSFIYFVGFLLLALIPKKIEVFNKCFNENKIKTTIIGFASLILTPLVFALVIITIIGIVLTPLIPMVYVIGMIMGVTAFSSKIGNMVLSKFGSSQVNIYLSTLIGLTIITAGWILTAILLGVENGLSVGIGRFALIIMILISSYTVCSGLGTAILTRFGFREYTKLRDRQDVEKPSAPAPPPIPNLKDDLDNNSSTLLPPKSDN